MLIPDETVREVLSATELVELIGRIVPLKRSGRNFTGLCPFHREKSPSFNVSPERQRWKCFGCGESGDAITFLMEHDKVSFPEAVQLLADRAGITIRREANADRGPKGPPRVDVLNAMDRAAGWFARQLTSDEGREALEYCRSRGINDESIETFQLGYAPGDGGKIVRALEKAGFDLRVAEAAGLVRFSDRDGSPWGWFRNRLIFPIADTQGRVVGFGARLLGPEGEHTGPKYLNSPDSPVFNKRKLLYGLPQARGESNDTPMLVMEGYTDVILTRQAGVQGPVATLGTALGEPHLRTMRRFGREIVIVFDGDNAGLNAAERTVDLALTEDIAVSLVTLPPGRDPAEVVESDGLQGFAELLGARSEGIDFRIDRLRRAHDLSTHAGQRAAGAEVVELASRIESAVARDLWYRKAAQAIGVSEEAVRKGAAERQQASARRAPDPSQGHRDEAPPTLRSRATRRKSGSATSWPTNGAARSSRTCTRPRPKGSPRRPRNCCRRFRTPPTGGWSTESLSWTWAPIRATGCAPRRGGWSGIGWKTRGLRGSVSWSRQSATATGKRCGPPWKKFRTWTAGWRNWVVKSPGPANRPRDQVGPHTTWKSSKDASKVSSPTAAAKGASVMTRSAA
jgi:DNA primase